MAGNNMIEVRNLTKRFGKLTVLDDISTSFASKEVVSIIGPSGGGKSTFLRCLNLLETPTSGELLFHGEDIMQRKGGAAAYRAKVGMVFQSFNLFNNMTVLENLKVGAYTRKDKYNDDIELIYTLFPRLKERHWQLAGTLSGGEQQMLAIGRAMMANSRCLQWVEH